MLVRLVFGKVLSVHLLARSETLKENSTKRVDSFGRNLWMRVRFPPPPPLSFLMYFRNLPEMVELTTVSVPPTWAMPPPPAPALLPEKVELMIVFEKCRVVKTYLRKDKARTQQVLEKVIADALETITAGDCLNLVAVLRLLGYNQLKIAIISLP